MTTLTAILKVVYTQISEFNIRKALAELRQINCQLNCQTGRYDISKGSTKSANYNKVCRKCCKICSSPNAEEVSSLPCFDPIIGDKFPWDKHLLESVLEHMVNLVMFAKHVL